MRFDVLPTAGRLLQASEHYGILGLGGRLPDYEPDLGGELLLHLRSGFLDLSDALESLFGRVAGRAAAAKAADVSR